MLERRRQLERLAPYIVLQRKRNELQQKCQLLKALSPQRWLQRGLVIVSDSKGLTLMKAREASPGDRLILQFQDGVLETQVNRMLPSTTTANQ